MMQRWIDGRQWPVLLFQLVGGAAILGNNPGFEISFPIPQQLDFNIAVGGTHLFGIVTIAVVARVASGGFIWLMGQLVAQFRYTEAISLLFPYTRLCGAPAGKFDSNLYLSCICLDVTNILTHLKILYLIRSSSNNYKLSSLLPSGSTLP